jgi:hypothetical protein
MYEALGSILEPTTKKKNQKETQSLKEKSLSRTSRTMFFERHHLENKRARRRLLERFAKLKSDKQLLARV